MKRATITNGSRTSRFLRIATPNRPTNPIGSSSPELLARLTARLTSSADKEESEAITPSEYSSKTWVVARVAPDIPSNATTASKGVIRTKRGRRNKPGFLILRVRSMTSAKRVNKYATTTRATKTASL